MNYRRSKDLTYVGIDEHHIGGRSPGIVVAATWSKNPELARLIGGLRKAACYLREDSPASAFPRIQDMKNAGVDGFAWIRSNSGRRFNQQSIMPVSIACLIRHLIAEGINPVSLQVHLDTYAADHHMTYPIGSFLRERGIPVHERQILPSADQLVPLVNYADHIAFRVGNELRRVQERYRPGTNLTTLVDFELVNWVHQKRIATPSLEDRRVLESVLA